MREPLTRDAVPLSQRTSEGVARILRGEIFAGRLKAGEPMPERLLADQLGVSRTPVREALFTLQSEGLVDLTPNRGATVRTITPDDIVQIYSLRSLLESYAARLAATSRTEAALDDREDAYAKLCRIGDRGTATEQALADLAFHNAISAAAGSQLLHTITGQVLAFTVSYRSGYSYPIEQTALANRQHRAILDALRDRDGDQAEALMREHITWSSRLALARFGGAESDGVGPHGE
jgi:DNA-binding GntR family transcriptional regulator